LTTWEKETPNFGNYVIIFLLYYNRKFRYKRLDIEISSRTKTNSDQNEPISDQSPTRSRRR